MILEADAVYLHHGRKRALASAGRARVRYTASGIVLGTILILTSFLDLLTQIKFGPISANGFLTVLYGAMTLLLLLLKRNASSQVLWAVRPGIVLALWAVSSILWNENRSVETIQNVSVLLLFVASIMLVAGQSANSGGAPIKLIKNLPFALYFSTSLFVLTIFHLYTVQSRLYALYASWV